MRDNAEIILTKLVKRINARGGGGGQRQVAGVASRPAVTQEEDKRANIPMGVFFEIINFSGGSNPVLPQLSPKSPPTPAFAPLAFGPSKPPFIRAMPLRAECYPLSKTSELSLTNAPAATDARELAGER